jgi:hypothetical protein
MYLWNTQTIFLLMLEIFNTEITSESQRSLQFYLNEIYVRSLQYYMFYYYGHLFNCSSVTLYASFYLNNTKILITDWLF